MRMDALLTGSAYCSGALGWHVVQDQAGRDAASEVLARDAAPFCYPKNASRIVKYSRVAVQQIFSV
jgi:hypothetical protein